MLSALSVALRRGWACCPWSGCSVRNPTSLMRLMLCYLLVDPQVAQGHLL